LGIVRHPVHWKGLMAGFAEDCAAQYGSNGVEGGRSCGASAGGTQSPAQFSSLADWPVADPEPMRDISLLKT